MITMTLKAISGTCGVRVCGELYYSIERTDILVNEALKELEAHDKREAVDKMNNSYYVSGLENKIAQLQQPKLCNTCIRDHCGCSIQDSILQVEPDATFDTFGCVHHAFNALLTEPSKHSTIQQY